MSEANQAKKYFDLHLCGLGYLSRVREVASSGRAKAKPFLACSIAAFHGDPDVENGIVYLNLDLIVSGDKAKDVIMTYADDANDRDRKVLVCFRAGDHYISTYEIKKGDRAGQMGTVLKGRLLKVSWVKVDGELVYREEQDGGDESENADGEADDRQDGELDHHDAREEVSEVKKPTVNNARPSPSAERREGERHGSGFLRRSVRRSAGAAA